MNGAPISIRSVRWAALLLALALPPHARKLNAPLPRASIGDVLEFQLVPGQQRVVYRADADTDEFFELWSRGFDRAQAAIQLNRESSVQRVQPGVFVDPSGRRVVYSLSSSSSRFWSVPLDGSGPPVGLEGFERFSPDGARVVYGGPESSLPTRQLFSGPTDHSLFAVLLTGSFQPNREVREYAITSDSRRVVMLADLRADERFEVFSVPIDGSAPFLALNPPLQDGEGVSAFQVSADGQRVVYRSDQRTRGTNELFVAPADGSRRAERVTPDFSLDRDVADEFRITPDGARVVFLADIDAPVARELYGVELDAPRAAVKLSPPLAAAGSVLGGLQVSADGARVVYRADVEGDGALELYSARLDGATPPQLLASAAAGRSIGRSEISADSSRVVFLLEGDPSELWSAPLDGSVSARPLHPPLVAGGDVVRFELAGARVIYRGDVEADEVLELFSAPLDGLGPALRLHPPLAPGRTILPDFQVSSDGRWVGFIGELAADERFELFVAPSDASAPPLLASDRAATAPTPVGDVRALASAGDFAVYTADQERDEVVELYSVPRDGERGPLRLHAPAVEGGDVSSFVVTPDGARVVFDGDIESDGKNELFVAPVDGRAPALELSGLLPAHGAVTSWRLTPDGSSVVFAAEAGSGQIELYAITLESALDGSASPTRLDPPPHRSFGSVGTLEITFDGRRVVYTSDKERRGRFELYSVALDGGAPATRISSVTLPGGDVRDFEISPDSTHVAFRADQDIDDLPELYGAPLDASAPPVKLNEPLSGNRRVWDYAIGAGNRVVFTAGLAFLREIASVPIDASAPPRRFLADLAAGLEQSADFWLTPAGTRVLFRSRSGVIGLQLFAAPIDAASAPVRLDGSLYRYDLIHPLFTGEDEVLYFALARPAGPAGTYRARLDGSVPPVRIDSSGAPQCLSADGRSLMVFGPAEFLPNDGLYVVPVDGSATARRASQRLPPGGSVFAGAFADGGDVLYIADEQRLGTRELYASGAVFAPARGGGIDGSVTRSK